MNKATASKEGAFAKFGGVQSYPPSCANSSSGKAGAAAQAQAANGKAANSAAALGSNAAAARYEALAAGGCKDFASAKAEGDPVQPATGSFNHSETDVRLVFAGAYFGISRNYGSSFPNGKSLGREWRFSADSAIIRGVSGRAEKTKAEIASCQNEVQQNFNAIDAIYRTMFGDPGNYGTLRGQYESKISYLGNTVLPAVSEAVADANAAVTATSGGELEQDALSLRAEVNGLSQRVGGEISSQQGTLDALKAIYQFRSEAATAIWRISQNIETANGEASEASRLHGLNLLALSPNYPAFFEEVGNGNLVLVNESGTPVVYEPVSAGRWKGRDDPEGKEGYILASGGDFIHYRKDGLRYGYDANGLLASVEDRNGARIGFTRNGSGVLTQAQAGTARYAFSYDGKGRLTGITGPGGRSWSYAYDAQSRLSSVTDPSGDTVSYEYDGGYLTRMLKPDGSARNYSYVTQEGKTIATRTTDEEGSAETFVYDLAGNTTTWTDQGGGVHVFTYDQRSRYTRETRPNGAWKEYGYDADGNLTQTREPGRSLDYAYDGRGNMIRTGYPDGSYEAWSYDANDLATSYRDRDGVVTSYERDAKGNVVGITKGGAMIATLTVNGLGQTATQTDGAGNAKSLFYDANGFLIRASYADGSAESYVRDAFGNATEYTDRVGRRWQYRYDNEDRLVWERRPGGLERTLRYSSRKDLVSVIERDAASGKSATTSFAYDQRHNLMSVNNGLGHVLSYERRGDGKVTVQILAGTWRTEYGYDGAGNLNLLRKSKAGETGIYEERYEYDALGRMTKMTQPLGRTTSYQYGTSGWATGETLANGQERLAARSAAGRLTGKTNPYGGEIRIGYDATGRMNQALDEDGDTESYQYDGAGRLVSKTDRRGQSWSYAYDMDGNLIQEKVNGQTYRGYNYDGAGRLLSVTDSRGIEILRRSYGADGRSASEFDAFGNETKYLYDGWGRTVQATDAEGRTKKYEYDALGRVTAAYDGYDRPERYEYDAAGELTARVGRDGKRTEYAYDKLGKLTQVRDGGGIAWTGRYDDAGRLVWEKGRPGVETEYGYDLIDRLTSRSEGGQMRESFAYDDAAHSLARSDARGATSVTAYDPSGKAEGEKNRSSLESSYTYTADGLVHTKSSFGGDLKTNTYDAFGRLIAESHSDGVSTSYAYDADGRLLSALSAAGRISYDYDRAGRLSTVNDEAAKEVIEYQYDKSGMKTAMKRGGTMVHYAYGKDGELLSVREEGGASMSFAYDSCDRETSRIYGNGEKIETIYDDAGRVSGIRETRLSDGQIVRAHGYAYDANGALWATIDEKARTTVFRYDAQGRLVTVLSPYEGGTKQADREEAERLGLSTGNDGAEALRWNPTSQEAGQLEAALNKIVAGRKSHGVGPELVWEQNFSYDPNGNRLTKRTGWGTIVYAYGAEDELLNAGNANYRYDREGRLVEETNAEGITSYRYDGRGRVVQADMTGKSEKRSVIYDYDALGRRTRRRVRGEGGLRSVYDAFTFDEVRTLALSANGDIMPESGKKPGRSEASGKYRFEGPAVNDEDPEIDTANVSRNSVYVNSLPAAYQSLDGLYYSASDRLGSTRTITDAEGRLFESYEYDAFGGLVSGNPDKGCGKLYAGKSYDSATGAYDYGYRDYLPRLARFTTVDPIRDGANWYAYCDADPVNHVDLWGLSACDGEWVKTGGFQQMYKETPISTAAYPHNGEDYHYMVNGVDKTMGAPVRATEAGVVVACGYNPKNEKGADPAQKGNYIRVQSSDGGYVDYYHLSEVEVKNGDKINVGQKIGEAGNTGGSTGPHLHTDKFYDTKPVDYETNPNQYLVKSYNGGSPCYFTNPTDEN